jgi:S1-C subfamily serine protease
MRFEKTTVANTSSLIVFLAALYFVGSLSESSSSRPSPVPVEAEPQAIVAPQPAGNTAPPAQTSSALTTEEIAARCNRSIALVSGRISTGTGFLVRHGLLATNAHVLAGERIENILVTFPSEASASLTPELLLEDPRRDLALLAVPTDLPPLEIESAYQFRRGQDVTVIGNPGVEGKLILKNAVSRGVMSTEAVIEGRSFYQLNIAINPGNSGGPTIDSSGKVIGVVNSKAARLESIAFCIPSADLLSAIAHVMSQSGDKDVMVSKHRARYVAKCLSALGAFYGDALARGVAGMDMALAKNLDPNVAFKLVRQETFGTLREIKTIFTEDFIQEFKGVFADVRIPESVRNQLRDTSNNCLAMWTAIDAPEGSAECRRARVSLLREKHRLYIERLEVELDMTGPQ